MMNKTRLFYTTLTALEAECLRELGIFFSVIAYIEMLSCYVLCKLDKAGLLTALFYF